MLASKESSWNTSAGAPLRGDDTSLCSPLWAGRGDCPRAAQGQTAGPSARQEEMLLVAPGKPKVGCR